MSQDAAADGLPADVVDAAVLAYARRRWGDEIDDINDASTVVMLEGELPPDAFKAALEVAYRLGRDSALPVEEWRTCVNAAVVYGVASSRVDADTDLRYARRLYDGDTPWIEHRRTGASPWQRVPDAG